MTKNKYPFPNDGRDTLEDFDNWTLLGEMLKFFGVRRMTELIGWCVIWMVSGSSDVSALRRDLEAKGMSKSATYRAAADLKHFHQYMQEKRGYSMDMTGIIKEISSSGTSPIREIVIK